MTYFDEEICFIDDDEYEEVLEHYGRPHEGYTPHSGRYEWGSGENAYQRHGGFALRVNEMIKQEGMTRKEVAAYFHMTTAQLTAAIAKDAAAEQRARYNAIYRLYDSGITSPTAIGKKLGMNESTIRPILKKRNSEQMNQLDKTVQAIKESVDRDGFVDVGKGVNRYLGVSEQRMKNAVTQLQLDGYVVESMKLKQATTNWWTPMRVIAKPGTTRKEITDKIKAGEITVPFEYSQDGGETFYKREPIVNIDGKRVLVRYAEEGGKEKDGTMELRRGVPDLNLGFSHYAQVRIGCTDKEGGDKLLYLKGMALYGDDKDFPKGVDIIFNTNKTKGTPFSKVLKPQSDDPDNPFGASLKEDEKLKSICRRYTDEDGVDRQSALNIVKEEGDVGGWKKSIASQVLGKQTPKLAKKQLDIDADIRKAEYDEIMSLTNPVVKEKFLKSFADECDSAAVHLAAAAFPRQSSNFILPFPEIKNDEIYAPKYNNGEEVVLIRYPHGGIFEVPRLRVNNNVKKAKETIGNAKDAVGINSVVAEQLSGADFDGDTVLVIPTKGIDFKTKKPFEGLQKFDNKSYKITDFEEGATTYHGHKVYKNKQGNPTLAPDQSCGMEMGKISNLITDMTIMGASDSELERAVKHSMVVIDAYKHGLDYKRSEEDFMIRQLREKYQGKATGGAATLLSRTTSVEYVPARKSYYKIDPKTGEKIFESAPKDEAVYSKPVKKKDGTIEWKQVERTTKSTKGYEHDPYELLSAGGGTEIEKVYADYARSMKKLGNQARLESTRTGDISKNPRAKETYAPEVKSLADKLEVAERNAPLERQAQLLVAKKLRLKKNDNPDLVNDPDLMKKTKNLLMTDARRIVGAKKELIDITDREWEAIQAGAINKTTLEKIVENTDEKKLKERAMPKVTTKLNANVEAKIRQMDRQGYTMSEIAEKLGVSTTTISEVL